MFIALDNDAAKPTTNLINLKFCQNVYFFWYLFSGGVFQVLQLLCLEEKKNACFEIYLDLVKSLQDTFLALVQETRRF